jgi:hypothetical protein
MNTHLPDQQEKGDTISTSPSAAQLDVKKHLSSSILLWMRADQPRQTGMDTWKGPHSGIISATRAWRSTGRSTSPSTTRACGR